MSNYPKSHLTSALFLSIILVLAISALPSKNAANTNNLPVSLTIQGDPKGTLDKQLAQPATLLSLPVPVPILQTHKETKEPALHLHEVTVRAGDSLSSIFTRAGLSASELHNIMALGTQVDVLSKIRPGQILRFETNADGRLETLNYEASALKKLAITLDAGKFRAHWTYLEPEIRISNISAKITAANPSLYHAGKVAGLSDKLIMQLSYIFQWDISFALDLRQGDTFTLLYQDIYLEGKKIEQGEILAAQFNNFNKTYTAVLYEDASGQDNYFTPEGRSLRKAFLRDPVHFSHVSSSFNLKRFHPIHKRVMPHRGIDYAANRGTPVLASGDGKVSIARRNSASGRYVVIKHGEQYTTKYLHLSAYAKGIKAGKSVKQGQTIGYVGATGWATAPHLHYEFLVEGVHRNPRTVKLPQALPIDRSGLKRFLTITQPILARLESLQDMQTYAAASD